MNMQARADSQPQWEIIIQEAEPEFTAIAQAAGTPVNYPAEAQYVLSLMRKNPALTRCPTASIREAVLNVAAVGLTLNPALKLAYLVPRKGECCLDISYQGLVKIAVDSGAILAAKAILVREQDTFVDHGPFQMPTHTYSTFAPAAERGQIIGGYCVARLPSGIDLVEIVTREDLDKIRAASKADKSKPDNPWNAWEDRMMLKSIVRRASNGWPKTEQLGRALAIANAADGVEYDITPEAPQLTDRNGRPSGAAYAEAALPQAEDDGQRADLLDYLQHEICPQGSSAYSATWKKMTRVARELVGAADHERLWALALQADAKAA